MAFFQLGRLQIGWGGGNNRYIKTPSPVGRFLNNFVKGQEVYVTESMHEYEVYRTTPEVYIVFNRFASMFANGRYIHRTADGDIIENSEIVAKLEQPNPLQTGEDFLRECALHYLIYGNRISYPMWASELSKAPRVINNLPPQHIKMKLTGKRWEQDTLDGIIEKYILENYGDENRREFLPNEVLHHRYVDPENPTLGLSPIQSLHMPISNIRASYGLRNVNLTKKGALGFITNSGMDALGNAPIGAADRKAIDDQYTKETHGIFDEQAPVAMVAGDLKFVHTAYPLKDSMVFEEISEDMKKIIDAVQLNDNIFSKEKSKIQANLNDGLRMAYQDAIIPFAAAYCTNMSSGLRLDNGEYLELDYSHLPCMQEDNVKTSQVAERNARAVNTLVQAGYTKEEASTVVYGDEA